MKHRPEIDGLRAVAVVPVILFHAGLTAVPGGFVGVDVFFVISGFLITSILLTDLEQNRFDLWAFYERRARRIAPALIVVLLVSLVVGWALLLPGDFANLGRSVLATALFGANIHFGRTIDYFAAEAEQQPMLHMWSLSIEEQYYFVLPLLMWVVWRRFGRQGLAVALAILAAASLIGSEWGARTAPAFNYFFSLSRAWELLAGSLCALLAARTQPAPRELPAAGGLAMIIAAYVLFDETTSYPALPTLLPVVGTALFSSTPPPAR